MMRNPLSSPWFNIPALLILILFAYGVSACSNIGVETEPTVSAATVFTFSESGVYRMPAGMSSNERGALFHGQQSIPLWQAETLEEANAFFYAPVTPTRYSGFDTLFWDAKANPNTTVPDAFPTGQTTDGQTTTEYIISREENIDYQGEADMETPWLWAKIMAPDQWQDTIVVPKGAVTPYTLNVHLWAQTSMPANPDHHVQLLWNGDLIGDESWDGEGTYTISVPLPEITPGPHMLTIAVPGDTDALADVIFVDSWEFVYQQLLDIREAPIEWTANASSARIQIDQDQMVWLLDITDPYSPLAVGPATSDTDELNLITQPGRRYWAGTTEQMPLPPVHRPRHQLAEDERNFLSAANYIVVGDKDFLTAAAPLIEYRQETGLNVATITPEQLYDNWGYGVPGVTVWQDFLTWRSSLGELPEYLLLLGDADLKPWNGDEKTLSGNLPTAFVRTTYIGETPTDVALLGDYAGDVAVGRIPANTVAEVEAVVEKTLAYERTLKSRRHLVLNDDDFEFELFAADIDATWQQYGDEIQRFATDDPDARSDILVALDSYPAWLHYVGHGSPLIWSQEKVLGAEDAGAWDVPAVVFAWTCLSGYFLLPDAYSLAEEWLLSPEGGAVAVIAPTAEDVTARQQPFAKAVYQAISQHETLGGALTQVRSQWQEQEMVWQYQFFGDPALTVTP